MLDSLIKILIVTVFLSVVNHQVYAAEVHEPILLQEIRWTGTSWFGSPIIHDLGTGEPKLILITHETQPLLVAAETLGEF